MSMDDPTDSQESKSTHEAATTVAATSSESEKAPQSLITCVPMSPKDPKAVQIRIYICVVGDLWHFGHANLCRRHLTFGCGV